MSIFKNLHISKSYYILSHKNIVDLHSRISIIYNRISHEITLPRLNDILCRSPLQNTISEGDAMKIVHALHKECRCWNRFG